MSVFGLLGEKLSHSFSPELHEMLGGYDYSLFEVTPFGLGEFMCEGDFTGINVTIPYKRAVIPYCDALSPEAERIGSVNTVLRSSDGSLTGHNTDYFGFAELIRRSGVAIRGKKALILGNGGVAPTIRAVLSDLAAAEIITVSRSGKHNYVNLSCHYDASIIVNATPVGMYPENGERLIRLSDFPECEAVFDLIYNPAKTALMLDAEEAGIACFGGLYMLAAQAAQACSLFTGVDVGSLDIEGVFKKLELKSKNISLIGMPGCGKTTVGGILAERLGRELFDTDSELTRRLGMSIPEYFTAYGENSFRERETEVLTELSKKSGIVLAAGGGIVKNYVNRNLLRQNSTVVYLRRDTAQLPTDGRPISQSVPLEQLYRERVPRYELWSDFSAEGETPEKAAEAIIKELSL